MERIFIVEDEEKIRSELKTVLEWRRRQSLAIYPARSWRRRRILYCLTLICL